MDHESIVRKLPEYAGGELPVAEAAAICEHLAGCEACRRESRLWGDSLRVFFGTPREKRREATEALVREVMARLPAAARRSWLDIPDLRWLVPVIGFSLAALLLSFVPYVRRQSRAVEPVLADPNAKVLAAWLERVQAKGAALPFESLQEGL